MPPARRRGARRAGCGRGSPWAHASAPMPSAIGASAADLDGASRRRRRIPQLPGAGSRRRSVNRTTAPRLAASMARSAPPKDPRPHRRCRSCGSATPSGAGCGSPRPATSSAPSSGRCAGPACRWRSPPASTRTRRSRYANAAPTGTASEAEYFEISVTERVDPESVRAALDEALPEGLDVLEVVEAAPGCARRPARGQRLGDGLRGADRERARSRPPTSSSRSSGPRSTRTFKTGPEDLRRALGRRVDGHASRRSGPTVRYCGWSYGTPHRPYAPTTS